MELAFSESTDTNAAVSTRLKKNTVWYAGLAFSQNHHLPDSNSFEILRSANMK